MLLTIFGGAVRNYTAIYVIGGVLFTIGLITDFTDSLSHTGCFAAGMHMGSISGNCPVAIDWAGYSTTICFVGIRIKIESTTFDNESTLSHNFNLIKSDTAAVSSGNGERSILNF